jgi:hypothetical protein
MTRFLTYVLLLANVVRRLSVAQEASQVAPSVALGSDLQCVNGSLVQLINDPGFEGVPIGALPRRTGQFVVRRSTSGQVSTKVNGVSTTAATAKYGKKQVLLSIPETFRKISDGASIGVALSNLNKLNVVYEASVDVKWTNPQGGKTAIVSFWVRHNAGSALRTFSGVDTWITTGDWTSIKFRFMVPQANLPSTLRVTIFPNQTPRLTSIRVDNFKLREVCQLGSSSATSNPELVANGDFEGLALGGVGAPYTILSSASSFVQATVVHEGAANQALRMVLPQGSTNYDYKQVGQAVTLQMGIRYRVSVKARRNSAASRTAIVNFRMRSVETGIWYGTVDLLLAADNDWHSYSYDVGIPATGNYTVSVQLNGWGNYGQVLDVTFDDLSCKRV